MRLGITIKIDVTKLDKARFFYGAKGTYCDLTMFVDTVNKSQYGDSGTIAQQTSTEERDNGVKMPIVGNARVFFEAESEQKQGRHSPPDLPPVADRMQDDDSSIPF